MFLRATYFLAAFFVGSLSGFLGSTIPTPHVTHSKQRPEIQVSISGLKRTEFPHTQGRLKPLAVTMTLSENLFDQTKANQTRAALLRAKIEKLDLFENAIVNIEGNQIVLAPGANDNVPLQIRWLTTRIQQLFRVKLVLTHAGPAGFFTECRLCHIIDPSSQDCGCHHSGAGRTLRARWRRASNQ